MRSLFHACGVLVIVAAAVASLGAQERKFSAQQGRSRVGVVLATSRLEIQPEGGQAAPSSWAFADLRCSRYSKEAEPLPGWGPLSVLTYSGKWLKNLFARNTMDHFIEFVPKVGQRVRLRFSDSDVGRINDQLKAGGVPQCEANVWLANQPELAQSQDGLPVTSHGE